MLVNSSNMRTASSNLTAHLAGEVTSIAICWKLTLVGGTVMGFTDHTADLTISSQLYKAATGFSPTSIETKDKFSVDNLDVAGILDAASIIWGVVTGNFNMHRNANSAKPSKKLQARIKTGKSLLPSGKSTAAK